MLPKLLQYSDVNCKNIEKYLRWKYLLVSGEQVQDDGGGGGGEEVNVLHCSTLTVSTPPAQVTHLKDVKLNILVFEFQHETHSVIYQ